MGILTHEIGHIVHRDNSKLLVRSAFSKGPQIILTTASLNYSRESENKADKYAIDRLQQVGISARGFYDFFKRRESNEFLKNLSFLSTHPADEERLKLIKESIKNTLSSKAEDISRDWEILKEACLH